MTQKPYRKSTLVSKPFMFQILFWLLFVLIILAITILALLSYRNYTHPKHVYGSWFEIGTPSHLTEVLTFNEQGVFRNERLISTQFEFDGQRIKVTTGGGTSTYLLSGTRHSPQLRRVEPLVPHQQFIREGYEHTVATNDNPIPTRRSAVSEHFRGQE